MCSGNPSAGRGANMASPPITPPASGYQNPMWGGGPPNIGPAGGGPSPFQNPGGGLSGGVGPGSSGYQNPGGGLSVGGPAGGGSSGGMATIGQPAYQGGPAGIGGPTGYQTTAGSGPAGIGGPTGYQTTGGGMSGLLGSGPTYIGGSGMANRVAGPRGLAGYIANQGNPGYAQQNQPIIGPQGQRLINNQNATASGAPPGYAPGMNGQMIPLTGPAHAQQGPSGPVAGSPDSPEGRAAWLAQQNAESAQRAAAMRAQIMGQQQSPGYQQALNQFWGNNFASGGPFPTSKG